MVFWFSDRQERWSGSDRHGYLINMTADQPPSENGLAWGGVSGDRFLITVLVDQKIKIPAWYCLGDEAVILFDSYVRFESKLGWHRLFLTVESTRGIRTLVVVFELLEEMVAWGCRNGKFNEQFQILPLELKVKFIWIAFVCISDGFRSTCLIYICYIRFMLTSP